MEILLSILLSIVIFGTLGCCIALKISVAKDDSEHSFSCPNCGEKFNLDWKHIFPSYLLTVNIHPIYRRARCPICKKIDLLKIDKEWL